MPKLIFDSKNIDDVMLYHIINLVSTPSVFYGKLSCLKIIDAHPRAPIITWNALLR